MISGKQCKNSNIQWITNSAERSFLVVQNKFNSEYRSTYYVRLWKMFGCVFYFLFSNIFFAFAIVSDILSLLLLFFFFNKFLALWRRAYVQIFYGLNFVWNVYNGGDGCLAVRKTNSPSDDGLLHAALGTTCMHTINIQYSTIDNNKHHYTLETHKHSSHFCDAVVRSVVLDFLFSFFA